MKKIFTIILGLLLASLTVEVSNAQNCQNKDYCTSDMGDFEYESQSSFGFAFPGDTVIVKTAVYANKKYNFWVCADPKLGDIKWEIIQPIRKTRKLVDKIHVDTIITYKMTKQWDDELGEDVLVEQQDKNGNFIVDKVEIKKDTLYTIDRYTDEVRIFTSLKAPNFEKGYKTTERIWIKFVVPNTADDNGACYGVYVGRRENGDAKRKFKRGQVKYAAE